jgi:hypothetical protein
MLRGFFVAAVIGRFDCVAVPRLEKRLAEAHIRGMQNIHKCTSALRPLIMEAEPQGIPLAENAINELVATTPAPERRDALESVRTVVKAHSDDCDASQFDFATTVNDYIEKLIKDLV